MSDQKVTPDDMLRAARFLGPAPGRASSPGAIEWGENRDRLAQEFALARAEEREACAKICDALSSTRRTQAFAFHAADECSEAIRARGDA